jgi:hypothetical protein
VFLGVKDGRFLSGRKQYDPLKLRELLTQKYIGTSKKTRSFKNGTVETLNLVEKVFVFVTLRKADRVSVKKPEGKKPLKC